MNSFTLFLPHSECANSSISFLHTSRHTCTEEILHFSPQKSGIMFLHLQIEGLQDSTSNLTWLRTPAVPIMFLLTVENDTIRTRHCALGSRSVSSSLRVTAQKHECPGVLCNMPKEFASSFASAPFSFFFFYNNTACCDSQIRDSVSLAALCQIQNASQFSVIFTCKRAKSFRSAACCVRNIRCPP